MRVKVKLFRFKVDHFSSGHLIVLFWCLGRWGVTSLTAPAPHDVKLTTITGLQFVQSSQFQLKLAQDIQGSSDHSRGRRQIFSTFFDNSDETKEDEDAAAAISADPALYWAKLKRHKTRKKNGALRGSYAAHNGWYIKTFKFKSF